MDVAAHSLHAIPDVIYRDPHPPGMATLTFWMWVAPGGEPLKPVRASIHLSAAGAPLESITLEARQLAALGGAPPRSFDHEGGLWLSHQLTTPWEVPVDLLRYELDVGGGGKPRRLVAEIKVADYQHQTRLMFPVIGTFAIVFGHASEGDHTERSQAFAWDIAPLGPRYELLLHGDGSQNEHFAGWQREVRAPAAGTVVRVQADVPDNPRPGELSDHPERAVEPWAVVGNCVVIDHGKAEYSLLGHLRQGSLTVAPGERIDAGQHIGRVGNSGHSSGPHLHYHLMDGPELFRSNGLPARFLGLEAEIPRRGALLEAP